MNQLENHPLYQTVSKLLKYMNSGACDVETLTKGLHDLNETFRVTRKRWADVVGDEVEEFLEVLSYFLLDQIVYFLKDAANLPSATQDLVEVAEHKRRPNFPKGVVTQLEGWLEQHSENPYPTIEEKQTLGEHLGLSIKQINDWFINARRRKLPK